MAENGGKYVTYKSMLLSLGTVFGIMLVIFGLYVNHMDKKVNRELYDRDYNQLYSDITNIKKNVKINGNIVNNIMRNQELVLRALKIEPVKSLVVEE